MRPPGFGSWPDIRFRGILRDRESRMFQDPLMPGIEQLQLGPLALTNVELVARVARMNPSSLERPHALHGAHNNPIGSYFLKEHFPMVAAQWRKSFRLKIISNWNVSYIKMHSCWITNREFGPTAQMLVGSEYVTVPHASPSTIHKAQSCVQLDSEQLRGARFRSRAARESCTCGSLFHL